MFEALQALEFGRSHTQVRLNKARSLIERSIWEPGAAGSVALEELARHARLSRYHFQREFKRNFGESPHQLATRLRLAKAQHLLRHNDQLLALLSVMINGASVATAPAT